MADLWPWLAIAGLGALHGLNPATGWMFAAAHGVRTGDGRQARRALVPIAIGHVASIAAVVWVVAQGLSLDRTLVRTLAGLLLIGIASTRLLRIAGPHRALGLGARHTGLAAWSFLMATAHGTGLMLVPALAPLCVDGNPARALGASGSLLLAVTAIGVHVAAMLLATGGIASAVCRGVTLCPSIPMGPAVHRAWTAALALLGAALIAIR